MQELGASFETSDEIPKGLEADVAKYREILVESAVELDDDVMEAYLEVYPWLCMPVAVNRQGPGT